MPHAELVKNILAPLLDELDEQARNIIESRFGLTTYPRTLEEIATELSTTRERVRRIERQTLQRLSGAGRSLLLSAILQEAAEIREALIEEHSGVRPEDLPSRFDLPWTDLSLNICALTTEDWTTLCLGRTPDSVA